MAHAVTMAGTRLRVYTAAVLEVPDLVREGDVVRVGCPDNTRVLARRAVQRVEGLADDVARRAGRRSELDLAEAVGRARRHRATLPGGQVVDVDLEPRRRVVHIYPAGVAGV